MEVFAIAVIILGIVIATGHYISKLHRKQNAGLPVFRFDPDKAGYAAPPFEEVRNIGVIKL